jgi:DNA-binding CsgD family transcriptional regulator
MKPEQLSPKEKEVLRLLLYPMRPERIAHAMHIKVSTVNSHLAASRRKLGVTDSLSAALMLRDAEALHKNDEGKFSGLAATPPLGQAEEANASRETEGAREDWDMPFATRGRPWNDLDHKWRVTWPIMLFSLMALGVSAMSSGGASLSAAYILFSR